MLGFVNGRAPPCFRQPVIAAAFVIVRWIGPFLQFLDETFLEQAFGRRSADAASTVPSMLPEARISSVKAARAEALAATIRRATALVRAATR